MMSHIRVLREGCIAGKPRSWKRERTVDFWLQFQIYRTYHKI